MKVFFLPWDERDRLPELLDRSGAAGFVQPGDFVAVKMHFGEKGNDGFINPEFVRPVLRMIKQKKAEAFLTDTNTIYHGPRNNALGHLKVAAEHGFSQTRLQVPVIVADGLRGDEYEHVEVGGRHFSRVKIAGAIKKADAILALSHFKGHLLTGFGGALKNLGMGCAARIGKFEMHSTVAPTLEAKLCRVCGACVAGCAHGALSLEGTKIRLSKSKCAGCGECILTCPSGALSITWNEETGTVQERLAEYAAGAVAGKRVFYLNFVNHVTENCDCLSKGEKPLVPDIGILASADPVAIDQASLDLVIKTGGDVFRKSHPSVDYNIQLQHAAEMGLGTREYELIHVSSVIQ